ncbi:MAG: hypothetical protein F6J86_01760 [Symploca sp. SIO1B1]|nr:hypothetical protein [Symploca sp. SIO1C2]NER92585.1 hypothetical protein [Symploca sp. SIO1B1]
MAIIVKHKESQNNYILLGTGFGIYKSSRPNAFFELLTIDEQEHFRLVAVADHHGEIKWFYSKDLTVIEIDGRHPSELGIN